MQEQFKEKGIVVIQQLLSEQEVDFYREKLGENAPALPKKQGAGRGFNRKDQQASWSLPDGVSKLRDFGRLFITSSWFQQLGSYWATSSKLGYRSQPASQDECTSS